MPSPLFLRSPPFPWVSPAVAAVSFAGTSGSGQDAERVFAAIRAARVGGAFWSPDDPWAVAGSGEIDAASPRDERAIVGLLAGAVVRDPTGAAIDQAVLRAAAEAAIMAATYRDPFTGEATDVHATIAVLGAWRRVLDANRGIVAATGMAGWKREAIARFLWDGRESPPFLSVDGGLARARARGGALAYWPSRTPAAAIRRADAACWQVEDGFVRSSGLGAECRPPLSVVVDDTGGVYYDAGRPSALERLLATASFDAPLLARARALREAIIGHRIGKYGVDGAALPPGLPAHGRLVLAVGQVEDDLSVRYGGAGIAGNLQFLEHVRAAEPDAYILYRPHPDVSAGLRRGAVQEAEALRLVDRVDGGGALTALIERADAVHVLSSLTGFEALMRGAQVCVHGVPFYAGWGLTDDRAPIPDRRGRRLTLDELVAATLILHPRYLDPDTGLPCSAEIVVARLAATPRPSRGLVTGVRRAWGATRRSVAVAGQRR